MPRKFLLAPFLAAALAACVAAYAAPTGSAVRIHRYATTDHSWSANAFWLESDQGVVLVDSLMLKSDVKALIGAIRSTGKPLAGILVTHPHVDHFGGVPLLREAFGPVPVYATAETAARVERVLSRARAGSWSKPFGEEFPDVAVVPDHQPAAGEEFSLAGMRFRFRDLGPMEAGDNAIVENLDTGAIFTGDATVFHAMVYVGEGRSCRTLQALAELRREYPASAIAYSGHYDPAPLHAVVDGNMAQVRLMRKLMAESLAAADNREADGSLKEAVRGDLAARMARLLDGHLTYGYAPRAAVYDLNMPGLESELSKESASGARCSD